MVTKAYPAALSEAAHMESMAAKVTSRRAPTPALAPEFIAGIDSVGFDGGGYWRAEVVCAWVVDGLLVVML